MRRRRIKIGRGSAAAFKALADLRAEKLDEAAAEAQQAGVSDLASTDYVARADRCESCGNRRRDQLIPVDSGVDDEVESARCGHRCRIATQAAAPAEAAAIATTADHELIEIVADGKCRIDGHVFDLLDVAPGERWDAEEGIQLAFGIKGSNCVTNVAVTPAAARELARRILRIVDRD